MERPRCYRKGMPPHAATLQLTWEMADGWRLTKFSCDEHGKREYWGNTPDYLVSRILGWEPRQQPSKFNVQEL